MPRPFWTPEGLWEASPDFEALSWVEHKGIPVFDPSSDAWYASAAGTLVRLEPNGDLIVVADDIQGIDVDVRASAGLAVSREPNDTIVLHRLGEVPDRKVLLSGDKFFNPRFSPDGTKVLVTESREEGRLWLVTLDGQATELASGSFATWHPDGERVVFARTEHDGHFMLSSELWLVETATRRTQRLTTALTPALLDPAISEDGKLLALVDQRDLSVLVVAFPDERN